MTAARRDRRVESGLRAALLCASLVAQVCLADDNSLEQAFATPPDSARPWVHWFWLDGNVSASGITADLEAMARVGIGGAVIMDITQEVPPGPVPFGGPQWTSLFGHAVSEAGRLGLEISMNNAPGWSGSGGPWVTPDLAMQKLVWSRTNVVGPGRVHLVLPGLPTFLGHCRVIATLAFPSILGDGALPQGFAPQIQAGTAKVAGLTNVLDRNPTTYVSLPPPKPGKPQRVELVFPGPYSASHLAVTAAEGRQPFTALLEQSNDGRKFLPVRQFSTATGNALIEFPEVTARRYRLTFLEAAPHLQRLNIAEIMLSPVFRIPDYQARSGMARQFSTNTLGTALPMNAFLLPGNVVDVTTNVDQANHLTWSAPPGNWTILRLGHMPTGRENPPARPGGFGLECDKLSKEAVEAHFGGMLDRLIADVGPGNAKALTFTHIDSWEVGFQNWTPRFREEFQQRRHYDPLPYLPAATGRVVGSPEVSERFLWDYRRTVAELQADNYAGHLADLAHRHGLKLSAEAYGNGPFDNLLYASRADVPMSEFWNETDAYPKFHTSKSMASAAHTYGKQVVAAEAFTAWPENAKWRNHPAALKFLADAAFSYGVNRLVFHRFAHQPWTDLRPGMTMGMWGIHYDRTQTWWEFALPWHQYIARCQHLLQQGHFVADVCYLAPEGSYSEPQARMELQPPLPAGHDYDISTAEAVLKRMAVKARRLVLPDGMSYSVLVLPPSDRVTPALLRKVRQLVEAGAVVTGPKPVSSPSLENYPACDTEVKSLAEALWQNCDGKKVTESRRGEGKLFWGQPLEKVLAAAGVAADFRQYTPTAQPLRWLHRRISDHDFYFVANPNRTRVLAECGFRVKGRRPELWDPESGEIEYPGLWRTETVHTILPMRLEPLGAVFVVFREAFGGYDPALSISGNSGRDFETRVLMRKDGELFLRTSQSLKCEIKTASGKASRTAAVCPRDIPLAGNWRVEFRPDLGGPSQIALPRLISWTEHALPHVKYYSGPATYRRTFDIPVVAPNLRVILDLGRVEVIASVAVNGRAAGVLWKRPFESDITGLVKAGTNSVEVCVANLWPNRLIGDELSPEDCLWRSESPGATGTPLAEWPAWLTQGRPRTSGRVAFSTRKFYGKESPLLPSGLLGPVRIRFESLSEFAP